MINWQCIIHVVHLTLTFKIYYIFLLCLISLIMSFHKEIRHRRNSILKHIYSLYTPIPPFLIMACHLHVALQNYMLLSFCLTLHTMTKICFTFKTVSAKTIEQKYTHKTKAFNQSDWNWIVQNLQSTQVTGQILTGTVCESLKTTLVQELFVVVVVFLSWTLWGSPSMFTHTHACTSTGTLHRVRGLRVQPFPVTLPCRQPHSIFRGFYLPFRRMRFAMSGAYHGWR